MDTTTYEQLPLSYESVEEAIKYLRENDTAVIRFFQGKAFEVQAPNFVELEVTETEPGVKGDTAQGATKQAIVETGVSISVPLFVNIGDRIKIDTRTGEYLSRV
jgi:elongation factor P